MKLQDVEPPRPMTYDLLKNVITEMGGTVESYAEIHIIQGNNTLVIDSRPSDAINVALRFGAPIFVVEEVLEKSRVPEPEEDEEKQQLKEWLENIRPEDFEIGGEQS